MDRRIFNHPIRKCTTLVMYPDKITIEKFEKIIVKSFDEYKKNIYKLGSPAIDNGYIEEWVEQYLAWLEIEESNGD